MAKHSVGLKLVDQFELLEKRCEEAKSQLNTSKAMRRSLEGIKIQGGRLLVETVDANYFSYAKRKDNGGFWNRAIGDMPGLGLIDWKDAKYRTCEVKALPSRMIGYAFYITIAYLTSLREYGLVSPTHFESRLQLRRLLPLSGLNWVNAIVQDSMKTMP